MDKGKTCPDCGYTLAPQALEPALEGLCPKCLVGVAKSDTQVRVSEGPSANPASAIENVYSPLLLGATFRGLEILGRLGQGGMGVVYKARQSRLDRTVAVKVLAPQYAASPQFIQRFEREAKILASVNHPNVIQVYEFGKEGDLVFLVMEYVDGENLETIFSRGKPINLGRFLYVMREVAKALEAVHAAGLVHRDIKPGNILLTKKGVTKLTDFGLAIDTEDTQKLTETGFFVGTPHYVSPEHVQGKRVDGRSDLYSLGVIIYQGVAGRPPFSAPSSTALLLKHVQEPPPPLYKFAPNAPKEVGEIVRKLLAKNPASRYESASALNQDLSRAIDASSSHFSTRGRAAGDIRILEVLESSSSTPSGTISPKPRALPWKFITLGIGAAFLFIALVVFFLGGPDEAPNPNLARSTTAKEQARLRPGREDALLEPRAEANRPTAHPNEPTPIRPIPESRAIESNPPASRPAELPVNLSVRERRREMDHQISIINLAGIAATYCALSGKENEAAKIRASAEVAKRKLDDLVESLRIEGQNPYVSDLVLPGDQLTWFENQDLEKIGKNKARALLGTFVANIRGGSQARVVRVRNGEPIEAVIRFDERPSDLLTIVQVAGLIPGQTVHAAEETTVTSKPGPEAGSTARTPANPPSGSVVKPDSIPNPAGAGGASPAEPRPPVPGKKKLASVPTPADQKEAEKRIREIFRLDYAKANPNDRISRHCSLNVPSLAG